jgi:hypothetical protein
MRKTFRAFRGAAAVKQAAIERLARHWPTGRVAPQFLIAYDEASGACSVMGATIEGSDVAEYERQLGIPAAAAQLHEGLLYHCGHQRASEDAERPSSFVIADFASDYPTQWLHAIPLGADLGTVAPRFVAWLLHDLLDEHGPWLRQLDPAVRAAGEQVGVLFDAAIAGASIPAARWKTARHAAIDATDAAGSGFARDVAAFIEAIAWPPESSLDELHGHVINLWFALSTNLQRQQKSAEEIDLDNVVEQFMGEMRAASQQSDFDFDAFVNARPALKVAFDAEMSPAGQKRRAEIHEASLPAILPIAKRHFESLLQFTRTA